MSGGAKAGLAFGLIILFALIGGGLYYLYRRYRAQHEAHERLDDEKMAMTQPDALPRFPEPDAMAAAALPRTPEAPRLSIRPMTEFDPSFGASRKSAAPNATQPSVPAANLMPAAAVAGAAVAAGAVAQNEKTGLRKPGVSAWERPGADRNAANDPANPFGVHAETVPSPPGSSQGLTKAADVPAPVVAPAAPVAPVVPVIPVVRPESPLVNPADFPLPASIPPSPHAPSFNSSISGQGKGSDGAAAAVAGAVAGAALGAAAAAKNSPKTPAPQGSVHRVQMDFMPSMEDELEIHTGQLLRIKHEYDDGWVSGNSKCDTLILTQAPRHSVKSWTAAKAAWSHVPASPRTLYSPVQPTLPVKVCPAVPALAHHAAQDPTDPAAFHAHSLQAAAATHPHPEAALLPAQA